MFAEIGVAFGGLVILLGKRLAVVLNPNDLSGAFARDGFTLAVEYTAPVFWLFFLLVGAALFVLRRRDPGAARPFRVPLYPALPLLFCATSGYLLYASLAYTGLGALVGVAVLAAGALLLPFLDPSPSPRESSP